MRLIAIGSIFGGVLTGIAMRWSPWPEYAGITAGCSGAMYWLIITMFFVVVWNSRKTDGTNDPTRPQP